MKSDWSANRCGDCGEPWTAHQTSCLPPPPPSKPTGAGGWPLVPSKHFPGELTLACPTCGTTDITLTVAPGGRGTGPGGRFRMGDPASELNICNDCGHRTTYGGHLGPRPRHSPTIKFIFGRAMTIPARLAALTEAEKATYEALRTSGVSIRDALDQIGA